MQIGDVVVPVRSLHNSVELVSGAGRYDCAIVVSLTPFIMVSTYADMRWSTVSIYDMMALCQAHPNIVSKCIERLEPELRPIYIPRDHLPSDVEKIHPALIEGITEDHIGYEFYVRRLPEVELESERIYIKLPDDYWAAPASELRRLVKFPLHIQQVPRDDLPSGFVLVQVHPDMAVDLSEKSTTYGFLYRRHANGLWMVERELERREIMQAEDQRDEGIVIDGGNGYNKA